MSNIIGTIYCKKDTCTWEVWTDGKAYSDRPSPAMTAYRWPDGTWRDSLTIKSAKVVVASEAIENEFSKYVSGIVVGPVDPLRHLRKK